MKKLVLSRIKTKAQEFLLKLKDSHVKTEQLVPSDEIQEYLTTEELTTAEKRLQFKLKIHMIDLNGNFKSSNKGNLQCDL